MGQFVVEMAERVGRLEDEIGSLADETTELGLFAEDIFKNAAAALYEQPAEVARMAIETARVCEQRHTAIHQKGLSILAWHQPGADEIRRVVELQQIAGELARIAENGRRIAEHALWLGAMSEAELVRVGTDASLLLTQMVRQTYIEVRGVVILTTTRRKSLARRLLQEDAELGHLYLSFKAIVEQAISANTPGAPLHRLLLVGVHLKDIGDRITAICHATLR